MGDILGTIGMTFGVTVAILIPMYFYKTAMKKNRKSSAKRRH